MLEQTEQMILSLTLTSAPFSRHLRGAFQNEQGEPEGRFAAYARELGELFDKLL
jgi:hypothetical protein